MTGASARRCRTTFAANRRRFPPWLPSPKQLLFAFLLCIIPSIAPCGFVAAIITFDDIASSSDNLHSSDAPKAEDRVWVYVYMAGHHRSLPVCVHHPLALPRAAA